MQKLGIDRQASMIGMDTERKRAQTELARAGRSGGTLNRGTLNRGTMYRGEPAQTFGGGGSGLDAIVNSMAATPSTPELKDSRSNWRDLAIGLPAENKIKPLTLSKDLTSTVPLPTASTLADRAERSETSVDRQVTQATGMPLDDRNIVAAIDRLSSKLDRLATNQNQNQNKPGYSDFLTADTNAKFART
jgi:hypothetical protein